MKWIFLAFFIRVKKINQLTLSKSICVFTNNRLWNCHINKSFVLKFEINERQAFEFEFVLLLFNRLNLIQNDWNSNVTAPSVTIIEPTDGPNETKRNIFVIVNSFRFVYIGLVVSETVYVSIKCCGRTENDAFCFMISRPAHSMQQISIKHTIGKIEW